MRVQGLPIAACFIGMRMYNYVPVDYMTVIKEQIASKEANKKRQKNNASEFIDFSFLHLKTMYKK